MNKIKNLESIRIPFGNSNVSCNSTNLNNSNYSNYNNTSSSSYNSNKKSGSNRASQNILIKKKYQILNSVTIDLIDNNINSGNNSLNVSSNSVDRSKSKKNK